MPVGRLGGDRAGGPRSAPALSERRPTPAIQPGKGGARRTDPVGQCLFGGQGAVRVAGGVVLQLVERGPQNAAGLDSWSRRPTTRPAPGSHTTSTSALVSLSRIRRLISFTPVRRRLNPASSATGCAKAHTFRSASGHLGPRDELGERSSCSTRPGTDRCGTSRSAIPPRGRTRRRGLPRPSTTARPASIPARPGQDPGSGSSDLGAGAVRVVHPGRTVSVCHLPVN